MLYITYVWNIYLSVHVIRNKRGDMIINYDELAFDFEYINKHYPEWLIECVKNDKIMRCIDRDGLCFKVMSSGKKYRVGDMLTKGDV